MAFTLVSIHCNTIGQVLAEKEAQALLSPCVRWRTMGNAHELTCGGVRMVGKNNRAPRKHVELPIGQGPHRKDNLDVGKLWAQVGWQDSMRLGVKFGAPDTKA